jgi:hypothetical protein
LKERKLSAEKGSSSDFHTILKTKNRAKKAKPENCQAIITWHCYSLLRRHVAEKKEGSRYFCESLFWASQPKQAAKT